VTVAATAQACFDALTDFEHLADWQRVLKRVEVIERDRAGATVEYVLDAKIREVRYRLVLHYDAPSRLAASYVSGDFHDMSAEWRFTQRRRGATDVSLELHLDPGWHVPRPIRSVLQELVMSRAMRDLKARVEAA
jgi:ribosome-associated toxin RatA of RatAB toxin-antitoxin module